jgi:hypothetical protein
VSSTKPNPDYAKHDPAHSLAPLLFRSLGPRDRKRQKLDVLWSPSTDVNRTYHFRGFEPLGADDLRVLQGLLALALLSRRRLTHMPKTEVGTALRVQMDFKLDAIRDDAIVVDTTFRQIAAAIGNANVDDSKNIRICIERLSSVNIVADDGKGRRRQFNLLSHYRSNTIASTVSVALNPFLAEAFSGEGHRYVHLNMNEVRALDGDIARVLHQALCARVDVGRRKSFGLDTLMDYVWDPNTTSANKNQRRKRLKDALRELRKIGWEVGMEPTNVIPVWIGRPTMEGSTLFWGTISPEMAEALARPSLSEETHEQVDELE